MSGSRLMTDDEDVAVQLTPSQEFHDVDDTTALLGDLTDRPLPQLNRLQKAAGALVAWVDPTATMIVGSAIANFYDLRAPSPGYYPATAGAWVVLNEASRAARAYATQESPHRYMRAAGGGSFAAGLAREGTKKLITLAGIEGMWVGLNVLRQYLYDLAISDPEEFQTMILVLSYLDSPSARNVSLALITGPLYWGGQKVMGCCCWPAPDVPPEENPDTRWYQKLTHEGIRVFYGVVASEMVREVMNTVVGYAVELHTQDSMVFGMPLVFLVRDPLDYYSRMPRPIASLDVPCLAAQPDQALALERPGKARNVAGLSIRLAVVVMAFGVVFGLNRLIMPVLAGNDCEDNTKQRMPCDPDPANLSYEVRMGLAAFLTGAGILVQKLALEGPSAIRNLCSRFSIYRNRQPENRVTVLDDEPEPERPGLN